MISTDDVSALESKCSEFREFLNGKLSECTDPNEPTQCNFIATADALTEALYSTVRQRSAELRQRAWKEKFGDEVPIEVSTTERELVEKKN